MKLSTAFLCMALARQSVAFAPAGRAMGTAPLFSSTLESVPTAALEKELDSIEQEIEGQKQAQMAEIEDSFVAPAEDEPQIQPGRYNSLENSIAVPFLKRPTALDGTHAGDSGFDPLGFTEDNDLYTLMESEIRHGRIAMLAVIGWPLSELVAPNFMLQGSNHLAPSVLNGFNPVSLIATIAAFGAFGFFEFKTAIRKIDDKPMGRQHVEDMKAVWNLGVPGDYNFDPLNFYSLFGDDAASRKAMRELEVAHGRGAMMGITGFALSEKLTGHPVIENSLFFHPNTVLPALAAAYLAFGLFYEVENDDQYLLQVKMTGEGEVRMGNMQKSVGNTVGPVAKFAKTAVEKVSSMLPKE
jgi:hypothetical protein